MTQPTPTQLTRRRFLAGTATFGGAALLPRVALAGVRSGPPIARVEPVVETIWGERIVDPYRWLETQKDPEWLPFMQGQDLHARTTIAAYPKRADLLARVAALSGDVTQVIYPKPAGGVRFLQKREVGAVAFRLVAAYPDGREQVLIDPATFASAAGPTAISWWLPSPGGRHIVAGLSAAGSEQATGYVVEVASGRLLDDRIADANYASPAWLPDGSGFFYNRLAGRPADDPDRYSDRSLYLHRIGTPQSADRRIMASGVDGAVPMTRISSPELQVGFRSDHVALLLRDGYVRSFALYTARLADVLDGRPNWRRICTASEGVTDFAISGDTVFLISTRESANGELLALDARSGTIAEGRVLMPAADVVLDSLSAGADGVYVTVNDGGEQQLAFQPTTGRLRPVGIPFAGWVQSIAVDPDDGDALVRITSWLEPATIFSVHGGTGAADRTALQPRPSIEMSPYEHRRIYATARDGTRVPVSLVRRRGPVQPSPCLIHVYGAYQWPSQPLFDARNIAFLEAGGVLATAHVRGGGEYGRAWHEGGRKATKPNTWRDLIACSEALIRTGYTTPRRVAIMGGSAGGIAVGRAMTERPDLFGAVISKVGMSNTLRHEFEPNGQPNVPEFGSVKDESGFRDLRAMDSYHAVRDGVRYPALLLTTGLNDARVAPHNAAKLAARIQAAHPGGTTLLRVDFDGGHNMNDLSKEKVDIEYADIFSFVLSHTR